MNRVKCHHWLCLTGVPDTITSPKGMGNIMMIDLTNKDFVIWETIEKLVHGTIEDAQNNGLMKDDDNKLVIKANEGYVEFKVNYDFGYCLGCSEIQMLNAAMGVYADSYPILNFVMGVMKKTFEIQIDDFDELEEYDYDDMPYYNIRVKWEFKDKE